MAELSDVELKSNIGYWFKLKKKKKLTPFFVVLGSKSWLTLLLWTRVVLSISFKANPKFIFLSFSNRYSIPPIPASSSVAVSLREQNRLIKHYPWYLRIDDKIASLKNYPWEFGMETVIESHGYLLVLFWFWISGLPIYTLKCGRRKERKRKRKRKKTAKHYYFATSKQG
jgi:hypothetical protein